MNLLIAAGTLAFFFINSESTVKRDCRDHRNKTKPIYHPLRHCQKSNKTIVASNDFESVEECADFAYKSNGLAFNYSPKIRRDKNLFEESSKNETNQESSTIAPEFHNCEVLDCPEMNNFSSVINDTRFDYYSLYAYPIPNENSTCIPLLGMFTIHSKPANYTFAYETCHNNKGHLVDIATEKRTIEMTKFLKLSIMNKNPNEITVFVGLNESISRELFLTSNNVPLECFDYRAWALGHPPDIRKKPTCVVLTEKASWKVKPCYKRSPFICELSTGGPNPYVKNMNQTCSGKKPNNRFMPKKSSINYNF